jgi:hypothetical protein
MDWTGLGAWCLWVIVLFDGWKRELADTGIECMVESESSTTGQSTFGLRPECSPSSSNHTFTSHSGLPSKRHTRLQTSRKPNRYVPRLLAHPDTPLNSKRSFKALTSLIFNPHKKKGRCDSQPPSHPTRPRFCRAAFDFSLSSPSRTLILCIASSPQKWPNN